MKAKWIIKDTKTNEYYCEDFEPDGFGNMIMKGTPYWHKRKSKAATFFAKWWAVSYIEQEYLHENGKRTPEVIKQK